MFHRTFGVSALAMLCLVALPGQAAPTVSPASVSVELEPGESITIDKSVTLPTVTPKLDLLLIVDLSGSYRNDLPNIKSVAPALHDSIRADVTDSRFGLATFKDFPLNGWGGSADYAYRLEQDLTTSKTDWTNAINAMSASGGADGPESQYEAVYQSVTGAGRDINSDGDFTDKGEIAAGLAASFREDATKVIAITTDAAFHNHGDNGSYPGPTKAEVLSALSDYGVKVIAIKAPGSTTQMDDLANETGGAVVTSTSDSSDIANAILDGLEAITFDVSASPSDDCDPLGFAYAPASYSDVDQGDTVTFKEKISVPGDITEADLNDDSAIECDVEFYADDTLIGTQTVKVTVPLNDPPVAVCKDLDLSADAYCSADGSIDGGSYDPDGDEIEVTISPEGPYPARHDDGHADRRGPQRRDR